METSKYLIQIDIKAINQAAVKELGSINNTVKSAINKKCALKVLYHGVFWKLLSKNIWFEAFSKEANHKNILASRIE